MNFIKTEEDIFYSSQKKEWSGAPLQRLYDRNCSIGKIVFDRLRYNPKKICLISETENVRLTNEDVLLRAVRIANFLKICDFKQNDIIGLYAQNSTHLISVVLACFFHGSAFHALNANLDDGTTKDLFNITKPKIFFCDASEYNNIKSVSKHYKPKIITLKQRRSGVPFIEDILIPIPNERYYVPANLEQGTDQTLAILCSSGSTGLPKAVTIPHTTRCYEVADFLTAEDISFTYCTIDWISSFIALLANIIYGAQMIITEEPFTPEHFLSLVQKYKVTFTLQSPRYMSIIARSRSINPEALASLKYFLYGGSKCTRAAKQIMQANLKNGRLIYMYGFSECGLILTRNCNFKQKMDSVGRLLPDYKLKIIDNDGNSLAQGKKGEICVYSGQNWKGYYDNPEATAIFYDSAGWFHSGDIGYFDEDNYLYVVDRKKDILKYQDLHYSPSEIEEVIARMPNVAEVCVFGIFKEAVGDVPAAAVEKVEGSELLAEDVVNYVRKHTEAPHRLLHGGAYIVKELPKTTNGKVDRQALKQLISNSYRKFKKLQI